MSSDNILCLISEDQQQEYAADFKGFDQLDVELKVERSPEEAIEQIGRVNPMMIILGSLVEDYEGIELLSMILQRQESFDKPVVVLPDKDDGLPPMIHSHSPATGKSSVESLSFAEVVKMVEAMQQEVPTVRKMISSEAAAETETEGETEGEGEASGAAPVTAAEIRDSTHERLAHLFENMPIESAPATSPYSGKRKLNQSVGSQAKNGSVFFAAERDKALKKESAPASAPAVDVERSVTGKKEKISPALPVDAQPAASKAEAPAAMSDAPPEPPESDSVAESFDQLLRDTSQKTSAGSRAGGKAKWVAVAAAAMVIMAAAGAYLALSGKAEEQADPPAAAAKKKVAGSASMTFVAEEAPEAAQEETVEAPPPLPPAPLQKQAVIAVEPPEEEVLPLTFRSGSALPRVNDDAALSALIEKLNAQPDNPIVLTGYTSAEGETLDNYGLAVKRAENVMKLLVSRGVSAMRFEIKSRGANDPVAPNDSEEGRRQNRRVTVQLIR